MVPAVPRMEPKAREERSRMRQSGSSRKDEMSPIHAFDERRKLGAPAREAIDAADSPRMIA